MEQQRFVSFRSHYTFQARYCTPGRGQEKGGAEGLIGFARRNFLVPLPQVEDFEELNQLLAQRCEQYGTHHRIGGREDDRTVDERFEAERGSLLPLPDQPFENFKPVRVKVDAYQTARVDHNRYSVPRENLAFIGRHGTGKSHAATVLGVEACRQGYRVLFWTGVELLNSLGEARDERQLQRELKRFERLELVVIYELGYIPLSQEGAQLLF